MSRVLMLVALAAASVGCASSLQRQTENWIQLSTNDLEIRTNFGRPAAEAVAREAQRIGSVVAREFPCASEHIETKIQVALLRDDTSSRGEYKGPPSALLDIPPMLSVRGRDATQLRQVFVHELAHRLLAACIPTAPPWVHEGIASYYETAELADGQLELGFPPYVFGDVVGGALVRYIDFAQYRGKRVVVLPPSSAPSLDALLSMSASEFYQHDRDDDTKRVAHYAAAWTLVNMLLYGDVDLQKRFARYLRMLRTGSDPERAWSASFRGIDVAARYEQRIAQESADWYAKPVNDPVTGPLEVRPIATPDVALLLAGLESWNEPEGLAAAGKWVAHARRTGLKPIESRLYEAALCASEGNSACTVELLDAVVRESPEATDALAAFVVWNGSQSPSRFDASAEAARLADGATTAFQLTAAAFWYAKNGDSDTALALATRALHLDGTNWLARTIAGDAYADRGEYTRAREEFRYAIGFSAHASDRLRRQLVVALREVERLLSEGATP